MLLLHVEINKTIGEKSEVKARKLGELHEIPDSQLLIGAKGEDSSGGITVG
ncbi:hypothetical protein [Sutcliffiella horikoshii]|uniref:hypothetical protein n=1 Tax=Sutcliffiella horikoshii TaxID=79883 RepID=UPI001653877B|nr:hypothetical protein [Sutcliffiella horikoshii]